MLIIGLTGGIASGKSTVADLFAKKGIPIIDADVIAREVVMPHTEALSKIKEHFGINIVDTKGELNRRILREKIFQNPAEKQWLENLLHPLIFAEIRRQISRLKTDYCIVVIPLLLETHAQPMVNRILVVDTPVELQRQRLQTRDQLSPDILDAMLNAQLSREQRLTAADDVILNDQGLETLEKQVQQLHERYSI